MSNLIIGYIKYKYYIITIHIENYEDLWYSDRILNIVSDDIERYGLHKDTIRYAVKKYRIYDIEDVIGNKFKKIDLFEIGEEKNHDDYIVFYKLKERAFYENFINDKQYLLFKNGYAGIFRTYHWNGSLFEEYYHINGNIEGNKKVFLSNGKIIN